MPSQQGLAINENANTAAEDRRGEGRSTAIYRPVLIETEGFAGFCLVKNLSPGGMMGVAYADFASGQPATVHFHPDHAVTGQIVWSRDGAIGVRFSQRIDVELVLHDLASQQIGERINRAPRLPIKMPGELLLDGRPVEFTLVDISQRGIKAMAPFLKPGDDVVVRLDGLDPHRAEVRWTQGGTAGLNFIRPLGFEELARWAIGHHSA